MKEDKNLDIILENGCDEKLEKIDTYSFSTGEDGDEEPMVVNNKTYNITIDTNRHEHTHNIIHAWVMMWFVLISLLVFIFINRYFKVFSGYWVHVIFFIVPMLGIAFYIAREMYLIMK